MAIKTYTVKTPVNHDNQDYAAGDPIELDDKAAQALLEVGAIEGGTAKAANVQEDAEKIAAIKAAIATLDKNDAGLWSKDGTKPKTEAIAAVTGWPVTAAERDAALAE